MVRCFLYLIVNIIYFEKKNFKNFRKKKNQSKVI